MAEETVAVVDGDEEPGQGDRRQHTTIFWTIIEKEYNPTNHYARDANNFFRTPSTFY